MRTFVKPQGETQRTAQLPAPGATSPAGVKAKRPFRSGHGGTAVSWEEASWPDIHGDVSGDQLRELLFPLLFRVAHSLPTGLWPRA